MNYANLIQNITENIKTNGSQAITSQVLQDVLVDMVGELGQSGALLGGVIDTSFVPDSTNDAQVVYIAESPGTYTNFNGLVVGAGEVAFFYFDGNAWAKSSVDVLEVVNDLTSTATDKALSAAMGKQLQDSLTQAVNDLTTAIGNKADRQTTEQALNTLQSQINDKADTTYVNSQLATKADTVSVNAALALKADTSAVNAALATKADTSALATKADKVVGAVAGNMAGLDASGNLVDSGVPASAVGDVSDKIDKVHDAEVGNVPMFKADGGIEDSGIPADNVAEQDGYYETMVVGGAENLIGSDIVTSQFIRRKTGGSTDVGTGVAILKTIKGNTLVWNQQVQNGDFSNGDTGWYSTRGSISAANGICTVTCHTVGTVFLYRLATEGVFKDNVSHTYLFAARVKPSVTHNMGFANKNSIFTTTSCTGGQWSVISTIKANYRPTTNDERAACVVGQNFALNETYDVDWFIVIDLTQMGLDSLSVAEFEALFPLNYYAYNAGSLLNLTATGLQTNGFNQWNEEWEEGIYNGSTGQKESATGNIRSKNFITAFPSTTYFFAEGTGIGTVKVVCYDAGYNFLGMCYYSTVNNTFTTLANTRYINFNISIAYGGVYRNDICINFSDVNKNGTYEPYRTETKALPITTMTGKVNGEGESVVMFPYGAGYCFTAPDGKRDEIGATKSVSNNLIVNLGDLEWTYVSNSPTPYFAAPISGIYYNSGVRTIVAGYTQLSSFWSNAGNDKCVATDSFGYRISNSAYTDADTFKAAMNGVLAISQRNGTAVEYVNDIPLNLQYKVDNDGTETILPENTSTPTISPIVADINYALNAIDTIRNLPQNYISKASMDAILTAFKTAGVITGYTLTWDATNQKYNCTITP